MAKKKWLFDLRPYVRNITVPSEPNALAKIKMYVGDGSWLAVDNAPKNRAIVAKWITEDR